MTEKVKVKSVRIRVMVVTDGKKYAAYGATGVTDKEAWEKLECDEWNPNIESDHVSIVEAEVEYVPPSLTVTPANGGKSK